MSTHTLTKVGVVNNKDNKELIYGIITLTSEMNYTHTMYQSVKDNEFFSEGLHEQLEQVVEQISTLSEHLRTNLDRLV